MLWQIDTIESHGLLALLDTHSDHEYIIYVIYKRSQSRQVILMTQKKMFNYKSIRTTTTLIVANVHLLPCYKKLLQY